MFILPDLPYPADALAPVISERTMRIHHGRHHRAYVKATNELVAAKGRALPSLEAVIAAAQEAGEAKLFNAAAQAWNHAFFWLSLSPERRTPGGELREAIDTAFGGPDALKTALVAEGTGHFGSGWLWLAADSAGGLKVFSTHDAANPLGHVHLTPLLVCDLWEHAYYLDHQNERGAFLSAWFDALPNWAFAEAQFAARGGAGALWRYPAPQESPQPA